LLPDHCLLSENYNRVPSSSASRHLQGTAARALNKYRDLNGLRMLLKTTLMEELSKNTLIANEVEKEILGDKRVTVVSS
jgi:hypothetical protein